MLSIKGAVGSGVMTNLLTSCGVGDEEGTRIHVTRLVTIATRTTRPTAHLQRSVCCALGTTDCDAVVDSFRASPTATRTSAMSWKRSSGALSRHRRRRNRIKPGVFSGNRSQEGSLLRTAASVSVTVSPSKVHLPVKSSNRRHPRAQTSALLSTCFPRACSGLM